MANSRRAGGKNAIRPSASDRLEIEEPSCIHAFGQFRRERLQPFEILFVSFLAIDNSFDRTAMVAARAQTFFLGAIKRNAKIDPIFTVARNLKPSLRRRTGRPFRLAGFQF